MDFERHNSDRFTNQKTGNKHNIDIINRRLRDMGMTQFSDYSVSKINDDFCSRISQSLVFLE